MTESSEPILSRIDKNTEDLLPLLDLLQPPPEGPGKLDQIIELLGQIVESHTKIDARLQALESRLPPAAETKSN